MFVGELGCWLVVGLVNLYNRYVTKKPSEAGYQAVNTTDQADADVDASSIHSETALNGSGNTNKHDEAILRGFRVLLLALPALSDLLATTLMNCGLLLVAASIYQMTRGALVLFVGIFSVVFLRRKLHLFQWLSLVGVVLGVAVVGLAGAIWPDPKSSKSAPPGAGTPDAAEVSADAVKAIIGVLLIAGAQIFTATQFVLEEYILERSAIEPLRVVGWEGIFGLSGTLIGMIVLHLAIGRTEAGQYGYFDMVEGWRQMTEHPQVLISSLLIMVSIG